MLHVVSIKNENVTLLFCSSVVWRTHCDQVHCDPLYTMLKNKKVLQFGSLCSLKQDSARLENPFVM